MPRVKHSSSFLVQWERMSSEANQSIHKNEKEGTATEQVFEIIPQRIIFKYEYSLKVIMASVEL
jgi:hypothetical protein